MKKRNAFLALLLSAAIGLSLPLLAGSQSYWPPAIGDYDGSSDYLSRTSDLSGNADGKTGILSFWFLLKGGVGAALVPIASEGNIFFLQRGVTNRLQLFAKTSGGVTKLQIRTSANIVVSTNWKHALFSWDLGVPEAHLYIDDTDDKNTVTILDDTIDYTRSSWNVCALANATQKWTGAIAEVYFAPNQYLDFSIESNRRFFIDRAGFPVNLGASGSIPTGTAPLIYLHTRANNAGINSGTGGDFAIQGAPLYSDGPFPFFPLTIPIPERGMGSRIH